MWLVLILASVFLWSWTNVIDSLLVRHYEKHPVVLMWYQSFFGLLVLAAIALFADVRSAWMPILFVTGLFAYLGDLLFFYVVDKVDISVVNIAWAIFAVFMTIVGFFYFGESWSSMQIIGALFVLSGVLFLSLFHHHCTFSVLFLLASIAALYLPFNVAEKAILLRGESVLPVFFWAILGRETLAFFFPPCLPRYRRRIRAVLRSASGWFHGLNAFVILLFFIASYLVVLAYDRGPVSLIAVVGNIQPFFVILFAWLLFRRVPRFAPRELLTLQSVQVKIISFAIVFMGLALLAIYQ